YQATRRLSQRRAKSAASTVLPVPARPTMMVAARLCRFSDSVLSRRVRARGGKSAGIIIFFRISFIFLLVSTSRQTPVEARDNKNPGTYPGNPLICSSIWLPGVILQELLEEFLRCHPQVHRTVT